MIQIIKAHYNGEKPHRRIALGTTIIYTQFLYTSLREYVVLYSLVFGLRI